MGSLKASSWPKYTKCGNIDSYAYACDLLPLVVKSHNEFVHSMISLRFQHDSTSNCVPGGSEGNYIMFAGATSGNLRKNRLFSRCSRKSINDVMDVKGRCIAHSCCFKGNKKNTCRLGKSHHGWDA